jgi:hypothetical protein
MLLHCSITVRPCVQAGSRPPPRGLFLCKELSMADPKASVNNPPSKNGQAAADAARSAVDTSTRTLEADAQQREQVRPMAMATIREDKANSEIMRTQIETAQQAVRSSLEAGMRGLEGLTQNWTRAFGAPGANTALAEQSAQNLRAVSQASSALARGAQDASRVWLELTQRAMRTNLEAFSRFAGCRSVQEVVALQSNLVRDNLQQAIESGEAIAVASSSAIREATRAIQQSQASA